MRVALIRSNRCAADTAWLSVTLCEPFMNLAAHMLVVSPDQDAPPTPNHEIAAARFFALDELPGDTGAGSRARIAEVLLGAPVSERW